MHWRKSKGLYHLALIIVAVTAFNWAFIELSNVNIVQRIFNNFTIPSNILAIGVCVSSVLVLWHNWVD